MGPGGDFLYWIGKAAGLEEQVAVDQTRLVVLNGEYARFSKAAGLKSQRERMHVPGFGVKEARAKETPIKHNTSTKTQIDSAEFKILLDKSAERGTMKVDLTDTDKKAIQDYMSAKSYAVNEKLRSGTPLTEEEQTFVNNLDAALKKMPTYQGNLQRSLIFDSEEDVQAFLRVHTEGTTVKYDQYLSTTCGATYNPDGQVQVLIRNSKRGRDISALNSKESEVLYERGMLFRVVGVRSVNGKYFILMEESNE